MPWQDKPRSIAPSREGAESLITVVKMGEVGRVFNLYHNGGKEGVDELFWSQVVAPGDALVMTLEANLRTKHEVPEGGGEGDSGSVVFRTLHDCRPAAEVRRKIAASERSKAREQVKKEEKKAVKKRYIERGEQEEAKWARRWDRAEARTGVRPGPLDDLDSVDESSDEEPLGQKMRRLEQRAGFR